ncbi:G-protein coupled receptor Mth2-like [Culicoides brevitarsis]|uniref:G-protein coupled receptor Mth2-like n=1 Tax=Culicoides brevitarsis TaxID=469753 RepID=UPI00307C6D6E
MVKLREGEVILHRKADTPLTLDYEEHCIIVQDKKIAVLQCVHPTTDIRLKILGYGMLISVPFLIITLIVYMIFPELRNVHGLSLMSFVGALTLAYTFLGITNATSLNAHKNPLQCTIFGYITYFSMMLSYFWLNVMGFDIFWTFRKAFRKTNNKTIFRIYCVYAYGMASFLLILILSLDLSGIDLNYKPGIYFTKTCFLQNLFLTKFIYFNLILLLLTTLNVGFFGRTLYKIQKIKEETDNVIQRGNSSRHSKDDNNRFSMYWRLFIIMGINWIMEWFSFFVNGESPAFYMFDIINVLQGVFIFLIAVYFSVPKQQQLLHSNLEIDVDSQSKRTVEALPLRKIEK